MSFIQLKEAQLYFGDRQILQDVSLNIDENTRACITGHNGSGKSTLLKVLTHKIPLNSGELIHSKQLRYGYLPQHIWIKSELSLIDEACSAYNYLQPLFDELREVEDQLVKSAELAESSIERLLNRQYAINEQVSASGWYERKKNAALILKGLGFQEADLEKPASSFSGGWQMRLALTRELLIEPEILILDEPINYLDYEAVQWLKRFFQAYRGGIVMVAHDRDFLDATVNEIWNLFNGKLKRFVGSFSKFEVFLEEEKLRLVAEHRRQQEVIERGEKFISRFGAKATKARQAKSIEKQLEKIELVELPESMKTVNFRFPPAPSSGRVLLELNELAKSYGEKLIFSGANTIIERGEKVALMGVNGSGKSTLIKIISGQLDDYQGRYRLGHNVKMAYFSQDQENNLDQSLSVIEEAEKDCPTELLPGVRNLLGTFLFSGDDIYKKISVLSGGEKNRLTLLKIFLKSANLILLDEPTNHLDLDTKDILLKALQDFEGSLLLVSHDRYFLQKLSTKVFEIDEQKLKVYHGDFDYYEHKKNLQELHSAPESSASSSNGPKAQQLAPGKKSKEDRMRLNALKKGENKLLQELEKIEGRISQLNEEFAKPEIYNQADKVIAIKRELASCEAQQEDMLSRWEQINQELES